MVFVAPFFMAAHAGLNRLRKNASLRITTPAPKAPPLLNQEGNR
jgi:hypothetical protein